MHSGEVDILVIDGDMEANAIRSCLENWSVKVNTFWIGQPNHIAELLNNQNERSKHILLSGHGSEAGFELAELAQEIEKQQLFKRNMSSNDIKKYLSFNDSVVLSTACMTGTPQMGDAFFESGASYYIAPDGYPDGSAALYFVLSFYYNLFYGKLNIEESYDKASGHDTETQLFKLYRNDKV